MKRLEAISKLSVISLILSAQTLALQLYFGIYTNEPKVAIYFVDMIFLVVTGMIIIILLRILRLRRGKLLSVTVMIAIWFAVETVLIVKIPNEIDIFLAKIIIASFGDCELVGARSACVIFASEGYPSIDGSVSNTVLLYCKCANEKNNVGQRIDKIALDAGIEAGLVNKIIYVSNTHLLLRYTM